MWGICDFIHGIIQRVQIFSWLNWETISYFGNSQKLLFACEIVTVQTTGKPTETSLDRDRASQLDLLILDFKEQTPESLNYGELLPHFRTLSQPIFLRCVCKRLMYENYIFHEPSLTWLNYSEILFEERVIIFTLTWFLQFFYRICLNKITRVYYVTNHYLEMAT